MYIQSDHITDSGAIFAVDIGFCLETVLWPGLNPKVIMQDQCPYVYVVVSKDHAH